MSPSHPPSEAHSVIDKYRLRFADIAPAGGDALSEAEERFAVLSNAIGDAIWDCDLDAHTVWWNDIYEKLFGPRPHEGVSVDWWIERIHPEDRERTVGGLEQAFAGTVSHLVSEYRFRLADGNYAPIRDRTFIARRKDGSPRRVTSAKADLSEQRRLEAQLQDTSSILQSFYDSVPICMGVLEVLEHDFEVLHANPASCKILGVTPDQGRGCRLGERGMPPAILAEWFERYRESSVTGQPVRFEYFSDHSGRWFASTVSAVRPGESGRPRVVYTAEDITHYRRSLEEQRGSEERFRRLYESNIIGIVSGDEERVIDANDVFLHMVGYTRQDLEAGLLRWYDMTAPEFRHLGPQTIADVKSMGSYGPFEKEYLRKDGSRVSALIGCIRLQDAPYRDLCFVLDLTESKRLQQRVLEAQKFESVGVLAGGIAHDFNNLLVGVIGHASLAQDLLAGSHPARELLSHVVKNGEQAAHLTRQLLAYSGKGRFLLEPLNLSELYEEISILVKPAISKDIVLEMNLPRDLPPVEGDRGQMRQVFTNLVLNAAESIAGKGGRIWVETGVRRIDAVQPERTWAAGEVTPGRYVYLEVVDTGCGMEEGTRAKIFDPFFTTKFVGRGLGLAAVAGIIRGHKGAISVTSTPGHGSRFLVLFPISVHGEAPDAVERAGAQPGKPTVLVIDDEIIVRQMARTVLERQGYEVILAENGQQAIELFERNPMEFSLVVLDLSMPGMSGAQTLPELRRHRPEIPVLITSGYTESQAMHIFAGQDVAGFLQKPFSSQILVNRIAATLDRE
ncbi:MAG: PAS domain S-box protein [Candidatus Sulfopaludibacter sp.]|nr:PAS domain S-box protein [Candidatus Sulfopaludibacter sp.]